MAENEDEDAPRIPRDAIVIQELLGSMGVQKYDPQVIAQLMELSHRMRNNQIDRKKRGERKKRKRRREEKDD